MKSRTYEEAGYPLHFMARIRQVAFHKEVSIPTLCSIVVSAVSLAFYSVLVQTVSTKMSAGFIASMSLAAMIQITFIPQSWIYVFGAHEPEIRFMRVSTSVVVELFGALFGLLVVTVVAWISSNGVAVLLAYLALAMAGSTAAQGLVRGEGRWWLYAAFIILPSFLRLVIAAVAIYTQFNFVYTLPRLILIYLLIPEGVRYLLLYIPLTRGAWRPVTWRQLKIAAHHLFRNWIYDIGSATTEVGDKYILSLVINPGLLIVYFFVRKISAAVTIFLEPFYSSRYRAIAGVKNGHHDRHDFARVLGIGYLTAAIACVLVLVIVMLLSMVSLGRMEIIPKILLDNMWLFTACLFIAGSIAANRWGRYVFILNNKAVSFLVVRFVCFIVFVLMVMLLSTHSESIALTVGFFCYSFLEFSYLVRSTHPDNFAIH